MTSRVFLTTLALAACLTETLEAQPVPSRDPSSTHIFPAGGRRGTTVDARVGAEASPPGAYLYVFGHGVTASERLGEECSSQGEPSQRRKPTEIPISAPREWQARLEIAPHAPLGVVNWRLASAQGGTGTRPFVIGDLPEVVERESNSSFSAAERIELPVTVNGQIDGERDLDFFRFAAAESDVVACEVQARRLGSRLDPVVAILTPEGRSLDVETAYIGDDPVLAFRVPRSGEYVLCVSNVTFHGDPAHVYRLNVSTAPWIRAAFPAGWQAGGECSVEFSALSGTGVPRILRETIRFPASSEASGSQDFAVDSLGDPAARVALLNRVPLEIDHRPNVIEAEPNESAAEALSLAPPLTVNGRFDSDRDTDWFRWTATAGEMLSIVCRGCPAGGAARPVLALYDKSSTQLAQASSLDGNDGTCRLEWTAPETAEYHLRLRDLQHGVRGGPEFVYRLTIEPAQPDFELSADVDSLDVLQEGKSQLAVALRRKGGFTAPVELRLEDLPSGVRVENPNIPSGANATTLTLAAAAEAPADSTPLRLIGRAELDGRTIERVARFRHLGHDSEGVTLADPAGEHLHLTIRHKPLFRLHCLETYQYAHRGTVFPYPMQVERLDGFDGPITLQIADRQNRDLDGIEMFEVTIPPGENGVRLPIHLPETMHINIQSQSQLYCQAHASFVDRQGCPQSVLVVSEKRNMLRTLPTLVRLKSLDHELTLSEQPAESQDGTNPREIHCRLRLERTPNFSGPMDVQLLDPPSESGLSMSPLTIGAGQTDGSAVITVGDSFTGPRRTLRFRATGDMDGGSRVITECTVPLSVGGNGP